MAATREVVEKAVERARQATRGWSRPELVLAAGLALALAVSAALYLSLRGSSDYAPLFTGLSPADAAAVVSQLESQNEPYRLDDQGGTILVPRPDVYRLRIDLAAQGIPSSGTVGFEVMDKLGLAATDFDRQVALLRATQGELERTIDQIDGVRASRVHVVMSQPDALGRASQPATAAVLVEMEPGRALDARTVQGIVHLVAASVPGLAPERVTVLDQTGRILSTPSEADEATLAADGNLALEAKFERDLESRLTSFLSQIFGPGNVATQVAAQLNFDRTTTESDLFTAPAGSAPGAGLLRSIQELQTSLSGQGGTGGVPGDSNFPTYPAVPGGTQTTNSTETQSTRNYELNEVKTTTQVAPGTVERLQVSVVVNKPLTPQEEQQVRDIVSAAVGADPARADVISVTSMPFDRSLLEGFGPSEAGGAPSAAPIPVWAYGAAAAALLLLVLALVLVLRRRRRPAEVPDEEALLAMLRAREAEAEGAKAPSEEEALLFDLREHARGRPDLVARTLRAWMAEEG
ncbi:MAG: flagellar M-ring protein FliF [Clostridia bacterium]|nr:flagellar M-ring protein FliF [Clostridia bacterium]